MLTFDQANQQGYTFADDTGCCVVSRDGVEVAQVHSTCPRFFALRLVAGFLNDDLATTEVTPSLVAQTTGETYAPDAITPDTVDPLVPASVAAGAAVAAAMATVAITSPNLSAAQKQTIQDHVTGAVQQSIDTAMGL